MARHSLIPSTLDHAAEIAANVRLEDKNELWASGLITPLKAMEMGMSYGDKTITGIYDGVPVCMWGVLSESLLFNRGTPWMVASKAVEKIASRFLREAKPALLEMLSGYDMLQNYVDERNTRAREWLRWMGFKIEKPEPYGALNLPFHRFWIRGI